MWVILLQIFKIRVKLYNTITQIHGKLKENANHNLIPMVNMGNILYRVEPGALDLKKLKEISIKLKD